jgi:hypothetical protein
MPFHFGSPGNIDIGKSRFLVLFEIYGGMPQPGNEMAGYPPFVKRVLTIGFVQFCISSAAVYNDSELPLGPDEASFTLAGCAGLARTEFLI